MPQEEQAGVAASGEVLRKAREARGLRAVDVAQMLKLSTRQVEAIENEQFDQLPGSTWIRGFVRNYARFLDLDPAPLLARLEPAPRDGDTLRLTPESNAVGAVPASPNGYRSQSAFPALVTVAVLVIGGLLVWHFDLVTRLAPSADRAAQTRAANAASSEPLFPPVSDENPGLVLPLEPNVVAVSAASAPSSGGALAAAAPSVTAASGAQAAPTANTAPPLTASAAIVLSFRGDSWVEVREGSGKTIFSRLSRAGEAQEVLGQPPFTLVIGNASEVSLSYQGKSVPLSPKSGTNVARVQLP